MMAWLAMTVASVERDDHRVEQPIGRQHEERIGVAAGVLQHNGGLAGIVEKQRRQDDGRPGDPDRLAAEMAHVGVHGFSAGHAKKHRTEDGEARDAMVDQERRRIKRIDRDDDVGRLGDADPAQDRDCQKPQQHHRPEGAADGGGAVVLDHEQQQQDDRGDRHRVAGEILARELEPLDGAQHRDRRRDHAVAIEQSGTYQAASDEVAVAAAPFRPGQRHQRQNSTLAAIVGAHHHQRIFQRNDDDQRPENQR